MQLSYGEYSVDTETLGLSGEVTPQIAYLLQNGFTQSLVDAAAFSKNQKRVKIGTTVNDAGEEVDEYRDMTDDEVKAMAKEKRDARFEAILNGTVGARVGGPRATPLETMCRTIAVERLRAKLAKVNAKLPSGDKTIKVSGRDMSRDDLIDLEMERFGDDIRAEAERRIEATKEASGSLDELFA